MTEYILLGFTALGAVLGYFKGFLKQISSLAGIVIGYLAARLFSLQMHDFLIEKHILSENYSDSLSFFLTIVLVIIAVKFLSAMTETLLKNIGLSFTNRFAGLLLGAVKYFFIVMFVMSFLYKLHVITHENSSQNAIDLIELFGSVVW
ncbi:MAG: CvpA family protein [Flavobacteriaceae bacterium]|jgi:membrane protein required for colicin V production|nr:CvpA family protein [Flavobacteriaceae bacterium]